MATVSYTVERIKKKKPLTFVAIDADYSTLDFIEGEAYIVTWSLTSGNLDGQWFAAPVFSEISIHAYGTDWDDRTLYFQGSNETDATPSNPANLKDSQRNTISMTGTNETEQILENMYQYRPLLSDNPAAAVVIKMLIIIDSTKSGGKI